MGYSENNGNVVLEMTKEDYLSLLFCLGMATGKCSDNKPMMNSMVSLLNRLNQGNPNFSQYEIAI